MDHDAAWIALLHVSGSSFPTGGFAHSFGLETYVSDARVSSGHDLLNYVQTMLCCSLGTLDAPCVALAYKYSGEELSRLDQLLTAYRPAVELRRANQRMGRAFLRAFREMYPGTELDAYQGTLAETSGGNYAVIFGKACAIMGIAREFAVSGFLFNSLNNLIQAGIKLIPLGPSEGHAILFSLYEAVAATAQRALRMNEEELGSFVPALDIASMKHERLYTRLYMS
ncbi:MAG: urease accessory protein UreF [Peptococcaceae bacterium]|jgi:urease accessory protein|nr:urease accessory protein UreF [Peptococcaceae bacterium]